MPLRSDFRPDHNYITKSKYVYFAPKASQIKSSILFIYLFFA